MIDGYKKTLLWNAKRPGPHAGGPNQRRNHHIETERLSSYNPRDLARYFVLACKRIGQVERRLAKMRRKYATLHRENKRLRALLASHKHSHAFVRLLGRCYAEHPSNPAVHCDRERGHAGKHRHVGLSGCYDAPGPLPREVPTPVEWA